MKHVLLVLLVTYSVALHAESGWTSYGKVLELLPDSDFRYRVKVSVADNPSGCRSDQWFYQDYLSSGSRQMYATLLEAMIHGLKARVYVNGKCGLKGNAEISAVNVKAK